MKVGIESLSFYSSNYYLDLKHIAEERGLRPERFYKGIGQEKMAVPPPDEDIITIGANAALQALEGIDKSKIDTVLFATESGIDQSKAGGLYIHSLLDLPPRCRVFELKQACYSATGGLMLALPYLQLNPDCKILIVASDVARYGLGAAGDPTQGAGAVAMVLSSGPKIFEFDLQSGIYSQDVMDFWRPNYREEALVDGKYSVKVYLHALTECWDQYNKLTGLSISDFYRFVYHLPFSRMGETAHKHIAKHFLHQNYNENLAVEQVETSLIYNRIIGNTYTASVFMALASLLENSEENLANKRVAHFSYGSGCVGELFTGRILPDYMSFLKIDLHKNFLENRKEIDLELYKEFYNFSLPVDGSHYQTPKYETGKFRLAGIVDHQRQYERV